HGAGVRYSTELVSFEEDADGVTATIRDRESGDERRIRARYLIAADGVRSPIRERLGIRWQGHGSFSRSITIYFKADVNPLVRGRNLSVIYVFHPELQGFFRFSKAGDAGFLVVNTAVKPDGSKDRDLWDDTSDERCVEYVRTALGDPELAVEIENVQRWVAQADWAERFRQGRVFLAGDSAHVMPPTGGYGGNTGVHDAHNLAWKLAYVLDGRAGEALLDTYDAERRPISASTVEQAYTRYVLRLDPDLGKENLAPIVGDPQIDLGYRYRSAAVLDADDDDGLYEDPNEPSGRPGTRAAQRPLDDRPLRAGVRAPRRRGMEGRGRGAPRAPGRGQGGDARPPGRVHRVADGRTAGRGGAEGLPRPDPRPLSVDEVQVLVVGGSLVGLSTAVFLATHGLHPLVVERHAGTAIHPRAAHFQQRTLELYRSVGLEAEILAAAEAEFVQDGAIMSVETL